MEHDCRPEDNYVYLKSIDGKQLKFSVDNIIELIDEADLIQKDSKNSFERGRLKWQMDFETAIATAFKSHISFNIHPTEIKFIKKVKIKLEKHIKSGNKERVDISEIK